MSLNALTPYLVGLLAVGVPLGLWLAGSTRAAAGGKESPVPVSAQWNALTPEQSRVIESCGTEPPFSGAYVNHHQDGTYTCARCGAPLFSSEAKFDSRSGWPSFDEALPGAVEELVDPDGHRVEIRCARCGGHLGHVFRGEGYTEEDTRHCVNSLSLGFSEAPLAEAYFAGGCFWGVEHYLQAVPGVKSVVSGYMGGDKPNPTYREVSTGRTGYAETVQVRYDPHQVQYRELAKLFFEIHDPTQRGRQGPDIGDQYRSAVFTVSEEQAAATSELITTLKRRGYDVATEVKPAGVFWPAEDYHQDYYQRTGKTPYCHARVERF
ncbi:MAG: bifunctional methionine sulfoxide reductase B/A protein [Deltaproteobacteria bacterium]|nr:bifunctional methionine sulfoxide reductase B/A protein [Deltaproteobacteria bacterium]